MKELFKKIFCNHRWEETGYGVYCGTFFDRYKTIYKCSKCGKLKEKTHFKRFNWN